MSLANMVVMADPSQPVRSSPPTLIQFQQVLADGVGLQLAKTVSVPAHHVRTTIRFTRLNLAFPERARFRYRLSGLEDNWSEPTSVNEASYTNLSPGPYQFEVQAGNINGGWDTPPAELALYVEPAWWQPVWLQACFGVAICAIGFVAYRARLRTVEHQWKLRFQERPDERTRIARELNDKLLQSFHGLILRFQAVREMLPQAPEAAGDALQSAIDRSVTAITEARDAVQALRGEEEEEDFSGVLANIAREFRLDTESPRETQYRVLIEGLPRPLHPVVRDGLYRIAREAVGNAFRHARPTQIELDIRYDKGNFRLRVRDDGCGIDPRVLTSGRRHHGLPGMRERATSIGGQFDIWSELCRGTEIEITIAGTIAYPRFEATGNSFTERRGEL
jgi:signal transduction histidine kinase